ncbi:anti-sigma factor antagonist [Lusitaniella coriacea LEGE 07157]|uniref:Anti-sigma factor antagonist n=1 Tax=Lusitaniella coriacea LEGE 07157 TaxID=945747 RepID=A0A8J7JAV6_9CYAN|nr:anti-sigma factor antagonist [Lusitaniella coriacea]MBE9116575.1 anti-sigma factor antagonist [Lusitaniella coriacea LEGE 07157]
MNSQIPEDRFPINVSDDTPVIQMPPRLSVLEAVAFEHSYQPLLQQDSSAKRIILNLENTTFIDSSGVGALVRSFKAMDASGVKLILQNVNTPVMGVLSMTNLDRVLTIEHIIPAENAVPRPKAQRSQLPETHPSVRSWIKRFIDVIGSLVGLGITAILFVPIAIAIKLDSPGPIFFEQTRCGWMGKHFTIWKFRSMCNDAEALKNRIDNQASGAFFKNKNDPRVTQVGYFLRRTSLDELPQFWNVLKGEMSLVGTRPPTPNEVEIYKIPEWQRLDVKPGMTGEWQVNGRSRVSNFEDVIRLDLRYQTNWSLRYDIQLILKTIAIVFNRDSGAY